MLTELTKEYFDNLEYTPIKANTYFNSIVIIPTGKLHDSGYMCMKYVLFMENELVGVVGGGSDVIHFNGIGGFGGIPNFDFEKDTLPIDYRIDCLPCGYLRLFTNDFMYLESNFIGSDFIFYVKRRESKNE